jgi:Ca2+-binding EF-hand superfamily protein
MKELAKFTKVAPPTEKEIRKTFNSFDTDRNGIICFDEFLIIFK